MEEQSGRTVMNLFGRLRLARLIERFPKRIVWAVFVFVNGFITCAILASMAMIWKTTFMFPSLGPTAFMLFFNPTSIVASPRNVVLGHAIGILFGYGALWLTGLQHAAPATVTGVDDPRIIAAPSALSRRPLPCHGITTASRGRYALARRTLYCQLRGPTESRLIFDEPTRRTAFIIPWGSGGSPGLLRTLSVSAADRQP